MALHSKSVVEGFGEAGVVEELHDACLPLVVLRGGGLTCLPALLLLPESPKPTHSPEVFFSKRKEFAGSERIASYSFLYLFMVACVVVLLTLDVFSDMDPRLFSPGASTADVEDSMFSCFVDPGGEGLGLDDSKSEGQAVELVPLDLKLQS